MYKCDVYIDGNEKPYQGQYEFDEEFLEVEIFNYHSLSNDTVPIGSTVKYKDIIIADLRNKVFLFSPAFYNSGSTYALTQYEKYRTNFYLKTGKVDNAKSFSKDMKLSSLTLYHPMLIQCFTNPSIQITFGDRESNYKIIKEPEKKIVDIQVNNIEKIEFSAVCFCSEKNDRQLINIESENYAKIYFTTPINYEDVLEYVNEFDIFMNAYCPIGLHSYENYITTDDEKCFNMIHNKLGKEKYYKKVVHKPVKIGFVDYIEKMYKTVNYRTAVNRNRYIPLEFKKPTSIEDQYTFYFRYIDLYMGEYLKQQTGDEPNNYERLSGFVDENIQYFDANDTANIDNFKNELNSLRNQYVHEGYYLPNNQFDVKGKNRQVLYSKTMDYNWLYRIVKAFKLCSYKILYTKILALDIDENELKHALKCYF